MPTKKILIAVLIIIVAVGGFVAGLYLLGGNQEIREEAAIPTGQAEVSISPETGNFNVGDSIKMSIYFNPANIPINGVAVRLSYPYNGSSPEVSTSETDIEINPTIENNQDWTCPTKEVKEENNFVIINIGCGNTSSDGYVANSDTLLANVTLHVNSAPSVSPLIVQFDNAASVITRKSDNQDILLIPTSTGSYTIAGAGTQITPSPTPTQTVAPQTTPTKTPTPTPTLKATVTPTSAISATPTTTTKGGEELPDAGVSYPTMFGVGLGIMVLVGAVLLAI